MGKPVILTVDDDASVSRAIARDLRRQYGEDYRVLRAESGAEALDGLRDLALRGEATALLLADHRMPGMTGWSSSSRRWTSRPSPSACC